VKTYSDPSYIFSGGQALPTPRSTPLPRQLITGYLHQVRTGALTQVHVRLFRAKTKPTVDTLRKSNVVVQLYDGISVPLASVDTLACNVAPKVLPSLTSSVDELAIDVPAADSQLIDGDILASGFKRPSSLSCWYSVVQDNVTFCPRIGGLVTTPHVGIGSVTPPSINQSISLFRQRIGHKGRRALTIA